MKKIFVSTVSLSTILLMIACSSGNEKKVDQTEEINTQIPNSPSNSNVAQVPDDINALLNKNTCLSCHDANDKIVDPPYKEIAKRNYTAEQIVELIYKPKPSNWPDYVSPMIGLPNVPREEALKIANWITTLK
jgi:cytochrome c551/c552